MSVFKDNFLKEIEQKSSELEIIWQEYTEGELSEKKHNEKAMELWIDSERLNNCPDKKECGTEYRDLVRETRRHNESVEEAITINPFLISDERRF